jgi:hypothetical protein
MPQRPEEHPEMGVPGPSGQRGGSAGSPRGTQSPFLSLPQAGAFPTAGRLRISRPSSASDFLLLAPTAGAAQELGQIGAGPQMPPPDP